MKHLAQMGGYPLQPQILRNWRLHTASRGSDHFWDFEGHLSGQDGNDAFGHILESVHGCLSLDRSTVGASNQRGIL